MGALTRGQIITAAMAQAGNTGVSTQMAMWLNAWLRDQALGWDWVCNQRELSAVAVPSGSATVLFGAGSNGEASEVRYIKDPMYLYTSAYSARQTVRVRSFNQNIEQDETVNNPAANLGMPLVVKCRGVAGVQGRWSLVFTPIPDRAYLAKIFYSIIPANTASDSETPWYPNDETMMEYLVKRIQNRDVGGDISVQLVAAKVREDRATDVAQGFNDVLPLDGEVFR